MTNPTDPAQQKLVSVFSSPHELEARLIQDLLRSAGIESMITGEMLPNIYPLSFGDMAKRDVLVLESEAEEARRIIAEEHEPPGEEGQDED